MDEKPYKKETQRSQLLEAIAPVGMTARRPSLMVILKKTRERELNNAHYIPVANHPTCHAL